MIVNQFYLQMEETSEEALIKITPIMKCCGGCRPFPSISSFWNDFCPVLYFVSLDSHTSSSTMQPHPTKVTQAVQLHQSGTPWSKYLLWLWRACRRYQETDWYTRRGRDGHRRATYQQQDHSLWYESRFTLSTKQMWVWTCCGELYVTWTVLLTGLVVCLWLRERLFPNGRTDLH